MSSLSFKLCFLLALTTIATSSVLLATPNDSDDRGCASKNVGPDHANVCVCTKEYCDELKFEWPSAKGDGYLISSTKVSNKRFEVKRLDGSSNGINRSNSEIKLNLTSKFQTILGFGGAFTDASAININSLSKDVKHKLIESYFGRNGLRYTFGRVPIGGSDFSTRPYTYDDMPAGESDHNLTHWSLAPEDIELKIPLIKYAEQLVSEYGSSLKLFGSPWSPPAWMKDNHSIVRGHLLESAYDSYANYLIKFYDAYQERNVSFWGGTLQNEPSSALNPSYFFNSLELQAKQSIEFLSQHFGPALVSHGYTKDKFKLMIGDDNLGLINTLVPDIMRSPKVVPFVAGLAFHWYASGWQESYDKLTECVDEIEGKIEFVLMTEACNGFRLTEKHVDLGSWQRAETYATDITQDLLRSSAGWVDWNLALDEMGGPNWVKNFVDSPIIVAKERDEFYKQPMFYVLGHFSRFFPPGSVRVDSQVTASNGTNAQTQLQTVAMLVNEEKHVVVNILNTADEMFIVDLSINHLMVKQVQVEGHSMNTIVVKI